MRHALLGLGLVVIVGGMVGGARFAVESFRHYPVQALVGTVGVLGSAALGARRDLFVRGRASTLRAVGLTVFSFVLGALVACFTNLLVFGALFQGKDWFDYVVKPLCWLGIYGLPCSIGLGLVLARALDRIATR